MRRWSAGGVEDAAFPTLATLPGPARDLAVAPDDAVYAIGADWVARLAPTGSPDTGFATAGVATLPAAITASALALLPQASGLPKILVGGQSGSSAALLRLGAGGGADPTFHGGVPRAWSFNPSACARIRDVVAGPGGAVILAGGYSYPDYADGFVAATDADGVVTFGQLSETPVTTCGGATGTAPAIAVQADGKVLELASDEFGDYVLRMKADGMRDQYSSGLLRSIEPAGVGVDAAGRAYAAGGTLETHSDSAHGLALERFVGGDNQPPTMTVSVDPRSVYLGHNFTVTANPVDPDGSVRAVQFELNQDGIPDLFRFSPGPWTASWGYGRAGHYPLTLRATDDLGAEVEVVAYADVYGPPSLPQAAITLGFGSPTPAKRPLTFSSNSTDDGTITSLAWDFDGDGYDDGNTTPITYAFPAAGRQTVRLKVTDNDGNSAEASVSFDTFDPDGDGPPVLGCTTCPVAAGVPGASIATVRLTVAPRVSRGAVTARLTCSQPPVCVGHVVIGRRGARNLTGSNVYGRARYRVAPGTARSLKVRLSTSARRRLRRGRSLGARALAFDATGGIVARVDWVTLRARS